MAYLFELSLENDDGTVTIPADRASRWRRQLATAYGDLSEGEKELDRTEARKVMAVFFSAGDEDRPGGRGVIGG
jgi:hypothetical protein